MLTPIVVGMGLLIPTFALSLDIRAGGPVSSPIPAECTVTQLSPNATGLIPTNDFSAAHLVYSSYYETYGNVSTWATQCLETCYGYGNGSQCVASLYARNVPTPPGYRGQNQSSLESACLMFDIHVTAADFVQAPVGQYVNEAISNINC